NRHSDDSSIIHSTTRSSGTPKRRRLSAFSKHCPSFALAEKQLNRIVRKILRSMIQYDCQPNTDKLNLTRNDCLIWHADHSEGDGHETRYKMRTEGKNPIHVCNQNVLTLDDFSESMKTNLLPTE